MVISSNNRTIYGMQSDTERYTWILYLVLVTLSSFIGDTLILLASLRYNALKLNRFIVAVIQHMAVCDLIISLTFVLPTIISLLVDEWVLGDALASLHRFVEFWALPVCNLFVSLFTTSKYILVTYPLRTRGWTSSMAHVTCFGLWGVFFVVSLVSQLLCRNMLMFDYTSYEFDADYGGDNTYKFDSLWSNLDTSPSPPSVDPDLLSDAGKYIDVFVSVLNFLTILVVILTTVLTLRYLNEARRVSRRSCGSLRWQGILTVLLTGGVFCVSSLPYAVYTMMEHFVKFSDQEHPPIWYIQLERTSEYLTLMNVMSNFYVYAMTIPSFRTFLRIKILRQKKQLVVGNGRVMENINVRKDDSPL